MRRLALGLAGALLPLAVAAQVFVNSPIAADRCDSLASTNANAVVDIDLTCANSFNGVADTLQNLVASPADGSTQVYYNFFLGASASKGESSQPTFKGYAGHGDAYLSLDGSDYVMHTAGASPSAFFASMHREDVADPWTIVIAFHYVHGAAVQGLAGTNSSSSTANGGFRLQISTSDTVQLLRNTGATSSTNNTVATTGTLGSGGDYLVAFSFDNTSRAWKLSSNGASFTETGTVASLASNTVPTPGKFTVGAYNGGAPLASGSYLYAFSVFSGTFTNSDLAAIGARYEARHRRDYTP